MKYYVVADVHGYFDELQAALTEQGYFMDSEPHKLVVCGDLFDRGKQAKELQTFILDLLEKEEVILIRGNHEDLAVELLHDWPQGGYLRSYHHSNGTVGTVCQLTGLSVAELLSNPEAAGRGRRNHPQPLSCMAGTDIIKARSLSIVRAVRTVAFTTFAMLREKRNPHDRCLCCRL